MRDANTDHLRNTAIYLAARGIPGVMLFPLILIFTRMLEPAAYGRYAIVLSAICLANAGVFQWLRFAVIRYVPGGEDLDRTKSTVLTTSLVLLGALAVVGSVLMLVPHASDWRPVLLAAWVLTSAQVLFDLSCEYTRITLRPWRYMAMQMIRAGLWLGLGPLLIVAGWGWEGPVYGLACAMFVAVLLLARRDWQGTRLRIDPALLGQFWSYGMPIALTVLLATAMTSVDRILLATLYSEDAAGVYSVAVDLVSQTVTLLMMAVNMAILPAAVTAWERSGSKAAMEQMRANASLLLAVGLPAVVGLTVLAPAIVDCLLGESFRAGARALIPVVAVGGALGCLKAFHYDAAFQLARQTRPQLVIAIGVFVLSVGLNLLCVPRWGAPAAAWVMFVTAGVGLVTTALVGRRYVRLPLAVDSLWRVVLASAVMGASLLPLRQISSPGALAAMIVGGLCVYVAVLVLTDFQGWGITVVRRVIGCRIVRVVDVTSTPETP